MVLPEVSLASGVVSERIGDEVLVIAPGASDAVRLSGPAAEMFLKVEAGTSVDVSDPVVSELRTLGLLELRGVSRRGLIKAVAIGAGAGISVLAMPSVAAAASGGAGGPLVMTLIEWYPSPGLAGSGDFAVNIGSAVPDFSFPDVDSDVTVEADDSPGVGFWNTNGSADGVAFFAYFSGLANAPKSATIEFEINGIQYTAIYQAV
jgi:hypothetical protein